MPIKTTDNTNTLALPFLVAESYLKQNNIECTIRPIDSEEDDNLSWEEGMRICNLTDKIYSQIEGVSQNYLNVYVLSATIDMELFASYIEKNWHDHSIRTDSLYFVL